MSRFSEDDRRSALVKLRQRLRITGLEVAAATKVLPTKVSLWEHGHVNLPTEKVDAIENYLTGELAKLKQLELDRVSV
jgi:transcriptional regulator with XRE-family HTH domain